MRLKQGYVHVKRTEVLTNVLHEVLNELIEKYLFIIHEETGFKEFIVGGLWASVKIANAMATIFCEVLMTVTILN